MAGWAAYEVESVRPGEAMTVRDLRSGEAIDVRERTFSRTAQPGLRFCGRAVPDGRGRQFIGAVFPVKVGQEAELLDLCDDGGPFELCVWVGDLHRPSSTLAPVRSACVAGTGRGVEGRTPLGRRRGYR